MFLFQTVKCRIVNFEYGDNFTNCQCLEQNSSNTNFK